MFEKLSDNLNMLMRETHISADELGRRTGIPASTIKKIRNRYNPNPTLTTLMPLAAFFSLTLGQLVGSELLPAERKKGAYKEVSETMHHIPILTWEESIQRQSAIDKNRETIASDYNYDKTAFALIVEENDWENLSKGTALLVDPTLTPEHRDFVIVHKEGLTTPSLKQLLYDEGQMYLKSLLHGYNITIFTPEHKILGIVVEYKKYLKRHLNTLVDNAS